jgi:hypothetical protein
MPRGGGKGRGKGKGEGEGNGGRGRGIVPLQDEARVEEERGEVLEGQGQNLGLAPAALVAVVAHHGKGKGKGKGKGGKGAVGAAAATACETVSAKRLKVNNKLDSFSEAALDPDSVLRHQINGVGDTLQSVSQQRAGLYFSVVHDVLTGIPPEINGFTDDFSTCLDSDEQSKEMAAQAIAATIHSSVTHVNR